MAERERTIRQQIAAFREYKRCPPWGDGDAYGRYSGLKSGLEGNGIGNAEYLLGLLDAERERERRLVAVLRQEGVGYEVVEGRRYCVLCDQPEDRPHSPDCPIGAVLEGQEPEEPEAPLYPVKRVTRQVKRYSIGAALEEADHA